MLNLLLEKQDYKEMLNDVHPTKVIGVLQEIQNTGEGAFSEYYENEQTIIKLYERKYNQLAGMIDTFRRTYRKNDRIVWIIRVAKIKMLSGFVDDVVDMLNNPLSRQIIEDKFGEKINSIKKYKSVNAGEFRKLWEDPIGLSNTLERLNHYVGYGIPKVDEYVFGYESPDTLFTIFEQYEQEWKKEASRLIPFEKQDLDEVDIIKEYKIKGVTYAWVDLNTPSCNLEACAMGHCGNSPRSHTRDTILSFREIVEKGEMKFWKPHLTFILTHNGSLTEMKGYANQKPDKKYHPYIVDLILDDRVERVRGGGYMPENNFSLNDLDDELREKISDEKEFIIPIVERWLNEQLTDEQLEEVKEEINNDLYNGKVISVTNQTITGITGERLDYNLDLYDRDVNKLIEFMDIEGERKTIAFNLLMKFKDLEYELKEICEDDNEFTKDLYLYIMNDVLTDSMKNKLIKIYENQINLTQQDLFGGTSYDQFVREMFTENDFVNKIIELYYSIIEVPVHQIISSIMSRSLRGTYDQTYYLQDNPNQDGYDVIDDNPFVYVDVDQYMFNEHTQYDGDDETEYHQVIVYIIENVDLAETYMDDDIGDIFSYNNNPVDLFDSIINMNKVIESELLSLIEPRLNKKFNELFT